MRRLRAAVAIAALSAAALLSLPASASAESPVTLGSSDIYDSAGVVAGREAEITAAFDSLYEKTGIQLVVVYVDSFTGAASALEWADESATLSNLGTNDVLLAIAVKDRNYAVSYPADFGLSEATTLSVETGSIEPALRNDDWAGAAIAAADGFAEASAGFNWLPVAGGVAAVGAATWGFVALRRRKRNRDSAATEALSLRELEQRASGLLVQLDDAVKTSEQELGFAVAQFGEESTQQFSQALGEARSEIMQAFTLKQQLDDTVPETDEERRALALRIIELCEQADASLDAQADAFDQLRELEKTAPDALAAAETAATQQAARLAVATQTVAELGQRYSPAAVATIADNPRLAAELLEFAQTARSAAAEAIAGARLSEAAVKVRAAQASSAQISQLLDAIDSTAAELAAAAAALDAAIADTQQDLAAAQALSGLAGPGGSAGPSATGLSSAVAAAEAALSAASAGGASGDPVARLAQLSQANTQLDQVLAAVRDEQQQRASATARLDGTLSQARSSIASANSFITTRRGGVGDTARTRLSEANRHLEAAVSLAVADPVAALREASSAASLAENALSSAQADTNSYAPGGQGGGSGFGGADLAGILTGMFLGSLGGGSSSSNGGWGGSSGRSGSYGGSSRSSGGFGGGGRSSGSSGRSSGGGRRSSGGRF